MTVVDKLPDEEKYYVLDFLVSLRKKQRDEFDWKRFKNALIERGDKFEEEQREQSRQFRIIEPVKLMPCPIINLETVAIALEAYNPKADKKL